MGDNLTIEDIERLQMTCPIIAEILDVKTRDTIEENASLMAMADFLVVNDLIARFIALIACRREVGEVLNEFLKPAGQEVYVARSSALLHSDELCIGHFPACIDVDPADPETCPDEPPSLAGLGVTAKAVCFMELSLRALGENCILIGYVKHMKDPSLDSGVGNVATVLNPEAKMTPLYWHEDDYLVLIGKDSDEEISSENLVVVR